MKKVLIAILVCFSLLVACSSTNVVKLDDKTETPTTETPTTEETPVDPSTPVPAGAPVASTTGKVAKSCDDSDLNDPSVLGKVTVEYSDDTSDTYFDNCVSGSNVLQEYICSGVEATSKNTICKNECLSVKVADQATYPNQRVGFCS